MPRYSITNGTVREVATFRELERLLGATGSKSLLSAARRIVRDGLDSRAKRAALVLVAWKGEQWTGIKKAFEASQGVVHVVQRREGASTIR
jgi:hypothetical protein